MKIDTATDVQIRSEAELKAWLEVLAAVQKFQSKVEDAVKEFAKVAGITEMETPNARLELRISKAFTWPANILEKIRQAGLPDPPLLPDKDYLKENEIYHRFAKISERKVYQIKGKAE